MNLVGITQRQEALQAEREDVVSQEHHRLRAPDDLGVVWPADGMTMFPQQPVAEGMEGVDGRVRLSVGHEQVDTRLHLLGGTLGEGQGQDLRRPRSLAGDEPGHTAGDDLGLACARPGDDEERSFLCVTAWRCRRSRPASSSRTPSMATGVSTAAMAGGPGCARCCGVRMAVIGAHGGAHPCQLRCHTVGVIPASRRARVSSPERGASATPRRMALT